ncbi:MAG: translocation/assembly module TamB domain-containing protein [Paramuribaculum sp.]|nr:translocation/assembly module TamB domain-containing protein [Paramuribaculum sp.]
MKKLVKWPYKILRTLLMAAVVLLFILPAGLYVALSLPVVQQEIASTAEKELGRLLSVNVKISDISIVPFNRLSLHDVTICDSDGVPAISINRLGAGISLLDLLMRGDIIITYAELSGLDARLTKATHSSPLNIQPIIDALKPKDKNKPPTRFDLRVNTVVIRNSSVSYDVLSAPADTSRFNPDHIQIRSLRADIVAPQIKNDDFIIDLRRLSMCERSGIKINNITGLFHITANGSTAENLTIDLAASHISLNDINLTYNGFSELKQLWSEKPVLIDINKGSYISASDIVPFEPRLKGLDLTLYTDLRAEATKTSLRIDRLDLNSSYGFAIRLEGSASDYLNPKEMSFDIPEFTFDINAPKALDLVGRFVKLKPDAARIISNLGETFLSGSASGTLAYGDVTADIKTEAGDVSLASSYSSTKAPAFTGNIELTSFSGARLMNGISGPLNKLGNLTARVDYDITLPASGPAGSAKVKIDDIVWSEHHFTDITAQAHAEGSTYAGSLVVDNPGIMIDLDTKATIDGPEKRIYLNLAARDIEPALFNIDTAHPERRFSIFCIGEVSGPDIDHLNGQIDIDDLQYGSENASIYLQDLDFQLSHNDGFNQIRLNSDIADGLAEGNYRLSALPRICMSMLSGIMPSLIPDTPTAGKDTPQADDRLYYSLTIKDTAPIEPLVKLPVNVIHPIRITGGIDAATRSIDFNLDAPYLQQGNKLIENTSLTASVKASDGDDIPGYGELTLSTMMPTKNGPLTLMTSAYAVNDHIDTHIDWKIARDRDFSGNLNLSAGFSRDSLHNLQTRIDINPGQLVFNDTVWNVEPSVIDIRGKRINIHDFRVGRDRQFVTIEGAASASPSDTILMTLEDVNLDYIFETLNIPTAMFGGQATGKFYATDLFTNNRKAYTPGLSVKRLTYNKSLMGDAFIKSEWKPENKAITIDADISQNNGRHSFIKGQIKPTVDSLDLSFNADRISVGFLRPFMSAFATDITGMASGKARLYGSFKLIDMTGDIYGENVTLSLGFTNTSYSTTDSIHFSPGRIDLPDLTIRDTYGNTARLNGWVTHECFKSPRFSFQVRDASNLLVYDVRENSDTRWFGRIFGNGTASINGEPGLVEIGASISTAPNSTFTFVLSDELNAQEYNFIKFRDRDRARKDSIARTNAEPEIVRNLKARIAATNPEGAPSVYRINLSVDVNPQAKVTLIMDPVGGDRITAYGAGNMRMFYDSANEDMRLNGTYTVERGKYNFTLQDIIIKEFNIKSGSSIAFNGDPYAAQLDLAATYSVNANLSDLDESFLADKDLNRTNVPVNALLLVTGDMRSPEVSFDLEFPTLTQDVYRKVRSIVNTSEMMNRQIIYLLALSRFYTPEYMQATKGNELVSVASSTLSSQLSNILGQLSDKWSLAPNIRSDRGDFSDVEVDVALSSHLLNNRLMLNGNFGYRDKNLNNNSFIGDFDIEYLLNRRGTIRLKAYSHYNDQNYYVKTALTTQGVGIMFKRDFDSMLSFLRPLIKSRNTSIDSVSATDSLKKDILKPDSVQNTDKLIPEK